MSPKNQKTNNATLFESLKESSVFYQRPVDDILFFDASNGILQCCNSSSNTSLSSIQSDLRKGQKRPRSSSTSKRPPPQSQQPSAKKGLIENVVYNEVEEIAPNSPSRKLATNNINRQAKVYFWSQKIGFRILGWDKFSVTTRGKLIPA